MSSLVNDNSPNQVPIEIQLKQLGSDNQGSGGPIVHKRTMSGNDGALRNSTDSKIDPRGVEEMKRAASNLKVNTSLQKNNANIKKGMSMGSL
jgi:hypothetical protein